MAHIVTASWDPYGRWEHSESSDVAATVEKLLASNEPGTIYIRTDVDPAKKPRSEVLQDVAAEMRKDLKFYQRENGRFELVVYNPDLNLVEHMALIMALESGTEIP